MLPVGRISRLFGLEGGLAVNLYDSFSDNFNTEEPLFVIIDGLTVPLFLEHFEKRGRSGANVRFADIDNQVRAEELIGLEFFANDGYDGRKPVATDGDELYFEDLVGYKVVIVDEDGGEKPFGKIASYVDNELNPLLSVEADGDEIYIPAVNEFIEWVDGDTQTIAFSLPEGLLEL